MKSKLKSKRLFFALLALLIIVTSIFAVFTMSVGAQEVDEGMSFTTSNMYKMTSAIPKRTAYTIESEIYVASDLEDKVRANILIGNYSAVSSECDGQEWSIEIHYYGVVRLYHRTGKSIFFHGGPDITTEITKSTNSSYLSSINAEYYNNGEKAPFDVRKYTGTPDAPEYVKVTVTADTVTGDASLYLNGEHIMTLKETTALKGRDYTPSEKLPCHIIGGDYRANNAAAFLGKIKNMVMYSDIRTPEEIKAYGTSDVFSVDKNDSNLLFAYDMTKAKDGFIEDLSKNRMNANDSNWTTVEGRGFGFDDELVMRGVFENMPRTYEAWIAPTLTSRAGVIMGNYGSGSNAIVNFEIHSSGKPLLYIKDADGNLTETKFNYDIRRKAWVHLVITHETLEDGGARFTCYVDGVKVDSFETALSYEFAPSDLDMFKLGGDYRSGNAQSFKGRIKNVAFYYDVLSQKEIEASYKNGVNSKNESLMVNYELEGTDGKAYIEDKTDNRFDLHPVFYENRFPATDYAYSFAVIGDTQKLVYNDAYNGTDYASYIYDWIVKNKTSKNIQFVMGMGDITDKDGKDQTVAKNENDDGIDQTDVEWNIAVAQYKKLYDAGIPYGIVMGNHDTVSQLDKYFSADPNFTDEGVDIGYYSGKSLGNYYVRFTVGDTKYMMVGLEYGPNDKVLSWAGDVIAANPEYRVIITTHAYMYHDGTTLDINESVPPRAPSATAEDKINKNNGDQIWTKLASQYENIIMVLSGHDPFANIVKRQDVGIHGNTVTQFLIDFQSKDTGYKYQTGMVAMFYFSADGKNIQVEYISTYKTLEAQKLDENAKDVIFNAAVNQFSFTIPEKKALESIECAYGTIPATYANEVTYPFVVFKSDKTFIGAYGDLGAATAAAKVKGTSGDYVVLMRRDAEQNTKSEGLSAVTGSITVDLGGNTLYKTAVGYVFDMYVNNNSGVSLNSSGYDERGTFVIKNGSIVSSDKGHPIACVNYGEALAYNYSIAFEFIDVKFTDLNGGSHILESWENGYDGTTAHVSASVLFDNCTFDYVGSAADTDIEMINLVGSNGADRVIWDVEIRGGNILSGSAVCRDDFIKADTNANGRADKVTFTRGDNGKYVSQTLPVSAEAPSIFEVWFVNSGNDMFFALSSENGVYATYELQYGDISDYGMMTDYGFVPKDQIDPDNYPLLLFKNGAYIGRYDVLSMGTSVSGALSGAKSLTDGDEDGEIGSTVQILLIGDATATGIFSNMGQILGTVIIDLNNHKLTQAYDTNALFFTQAKKWKGMDDATFKIINGEIVLKTQLLTFSAHGSGYQDGDGTDKYKSFNITFDNINFSYFENASAKNFLGAFADGTGVYGKEVGYNIVFNDCEFDFTNANSMALIMNANDSNIASEKGETAANCIVRVRVNGGNIITSNAAVEFYKTVNNGSDVVFGKIGEGSYTSLSLIGANADEAISASLISADGITMVFAKGAVSGAYVNYTLLPKVVADYNIKTSIMLWSNFVYNVYLLKSDVLESVSVDGEIYDTDTLTVTDIDGVCYYLVSIDLAANESLRDIPVVITLNTDGKVIRYSQTFNVVKYSKLILDGEHSHEEKALIRDMLSYARAAYVYFKTDDAASVAQINAILGENYDVANAPAIEGSTVANAPDFKSGTFVLDGTPAMRFYLADGADATKYAFFIDGKRVNTEVSEDGKYIDIDVYAYALCETVTYTADGAEGGSYHINAYYEWSKTQNNENLTNLVARFWKYLQSARAYRDSVVGN